VGGELLRLLLFHGNAKIVAATSRTSEGKFVYEVYPNLRKLTDLRFTNQALEELAEQCDVLFFALPSGESQKQIPRVINKTKVIDLAGDLRIKSFPESQKYYGTNPQSKGLLNKSVYGLTEFNRDLIRNAELVACPGCFPTGSLLGLLPLAKEGVIEGSQIVIDAKTGSSGSGDEPSMNTHHPERDDDFKAYGIFDHKHYPEIRQEIGKSSDNFDLMFTPHSAPLVRGIFSTIYVFTKDSVNKTDLGEIYEKHYRSEFFVRLVPQVRLKVVSRTNFCDVSYDVNENKIIICTAIDNLLKGGAGQAVQNMNVMFDLDEREGLTFPGTHP
jgi:N-acetyl-gamma-glutamyl-phosphate reductase common form